MRIKLFTEQVLENIPTEEDLTDQSIMESIYAIRKLKALAEAQEYGSIEVANKTNSCEQAFSEKYQIWFTVDEFNWL